jgi:hypothetical protein
MPAQKPLLGVDTGNEDGSRERCEQHSHTGSKGERPSEHVHQQAQIAWVANSAVDSIRNECVILLDGHQPAESPAQHEHWP